MVHRHNTHTVDTEDQYLHRIPRFAWGLAAAFISAHLIHAFVTPGACWSFALLYFSGWLPALPGVALTATAALLTLPGSTLSARITAQKIPVITLPLVAIGLLLLTVTYTFGHNFFGDGGLAVKYADGSFHAAGGEVRQGIVFAIVWLANSSPWSAHTIYRILSFTGAALFLSALLALLWQRKETPWWTVGVMLFAMLQITSTFFVGYFETYAIPTGLFALYLSLAASTTARRRVSALLIVLHILLILLHPLFVVFLPALAFRFALPKWGFRRCMVVFSGMIGAGLMLHLVMSGMHSGPGISTALLPLVAYNTQAYGLFSIRHMLDVVQLAVIVLFPSFLVLTYNGTRVCASPSGKMLCPYVLTASICMVCFDFKLGALDWDVFAMVCLPIIWLAIHHLITMLSKHSNTTVALMLALGISLFRFIPWLIINRSAVSAAPYIQAIADHDIRQQLPGRRKSLGLRFLEQGLHRHYLIMTDQCHDIMDSSSALTQNNYAVMLMREGKDRVALDILLQITASTPTFPLPYANIAQIYERSLGQPDSAAWYYRRAWNLDSSNTSFLLGLARCEARCGMQREAAKSLERYIVLRPADGDALVLLARTKIEMQDFTAAIAHLRAASRLNLRPETAKITCALAKAVPGFAATISCTQVLEELRGRSQ